MKRLNLVNWKFFSIVLLAVIVSSCSKDEKDPVVSKTIESIEIWKGNITQWEINSNLTFSYTSGRLTKFKKDDNNPEVTYAYNSSNNIECGWHYGSSNYYGMSIQLQNGRAERAESAELGTYRYYYNDGYLVNWDVRMNSMITAEYRHTWSKGNLERIENLESDNTYNDTYVASSILNEYNIDLNVLSHFIDKRTDYIENMNTFAQLIGITGKRSQNFLQNMRYSYEYSYDDNGRLLTIVMREITNSSGEGYLFKIIYND